MKAPRKNRHLVVHELEDEVLLYDPQIERSHRLNASAALIWRTCDGRHCAEQIAQLLTRRFEVEYDIALHDTRRVIDRMVGEDVLTYQASSE